MANTLDNPTIQDQEGLKEFAEALSDRAPSIEQDMAKLARAPSDRVVIADLFRAIHNIKGDAALCKLDLANRIAHPIESLLTRLRSGDLRYTPLLGEAILLAVDRLELAIEALVAGKVVRHLKLSDLVEGLEKMTLAGRDALDPTAAGVIQAVTGFRPQASLRGAIGKLPVEPSAHDRVAEDLHFFRSLALQFEARSPLFAGRTGRVLELSLDTDKAAGSTRWTRRSSKRRSTCTTWA